MCKGKTSYSAVILAAALMLTGISSCSQKPAATSSSTVHTTWQETTTTVSEVTTETSETTTIDPAIARDPFIGEWIGFLKVGKKSFLYTVKFNADGTGQYDMAGKILALNYTTDNGKITITFLEEGYTPVTLDYELDGDKLNIKDSFGKDTFYIKAESEKATN